MEIVRGAVEEFLAGTSERDRGSMLTQIAEVWDPRIELDSSEAAVLDLTGVYRGRDAVGRFWQEWLAAWENNRFEYQLVDAGDRVVQLFDLRMRGRSTGIEMPFGKIAWVYTLENGLVIHQKLRSPRSRGAVGARRSAKLVNQDTERRRNRTFQAWGCHALLVLKTSGDDRQERLAMRKKPLVSRGALQYALQSHQEVAT